MTDFGFSCDLAGLRRAEDTHVGVLGLVNLFGIESPGLTSALAIGDYVAALISSHPPGT